MQLIEFLKDIVNFICDPKILISLAAIFLFASLKWPKTFYSDKAAKILFGVMIAFFLVSLFDADFRLVVTKPDNVPIVGMLFMIERSGFIQIMNPAVWRLKFVAEIHEYCFQHF